MPFISAIVCSLIGGALGGFIFANVLGSASFLTAFAIISGCSLLGTILFVAATNLSPAPAVTTAAPAQSAANKPRKPSGGNNKGRGNRQEKSASQKPKQGKPKPKVTSTATGPVEQGEVKRFFGNKGYGFIRRSNDEEVFVHYRSIEGGDEDGEGGRRYLKEGQSVEFVVVDTDRGPQAENVRAL